MRPTFMGFEAAKTAIYTNQKSLDITGNNLANLNTTGYTRQRVDRASIAPGAYTTKVASSRVSLMGQGVEAMGVSQTRDAFLDKRFRDEYTKTSYYGQAGNILSDIQSALVDGQDLKDESGMLGALKSIYDSLSDFTSNPTSDTEANIVLSSFRNITQVLQQIDARLTNVAKQHIADMTVTVDRTNELLQQIAHYNKMIGDDATVLTSDSEYFRPNELLDQRNLLLDELSAYGDISVTELSNGKVNVTMGGKQVVNENEYDALTMLVNSDGRDQTVSLQWRSSGKPAGLTGGALMASVQYLNGRGHNVQNSTETPNQGILYYRDRIDTFASALTQMVNTSVPEYDPTTKMPKVDPVTGKIVYKTLLSAKKSDGKTDITEPITAANVSISDEWSNGGASYFIYNKDKNVSEYAQAISLQLTEGAYQFNSYGEVFVGSFSDYQADMLGRVATDLAFSSGRQEAAGAVADDFQDRRDAISGVSKDEETADMLKYQKSYEAAARLMTIMDDLLDVLINRMGRAGL